MKIATSSFSLATKLVAEVNLMSIITNFEKDNKGFWLGFTLKNANGSEFLDEGLPLPNARLHYSGAGGIAWWWLIDGYFATKKNNEFLNDIIARFLLTFAQHNPERLPYKPKNEFIEHKHAYKLKQFSTKLNSIKNKIHIPQRAEMFADFTFWAIKLYAEDLIREQNFIVYKQLENWALSNFVDKEQSTIKAKCRSIWNWYNDRNFKLITKHKPQKIYMEATKMTRIEHIKKVTKNIKDKNYKAVINLITGLYSDEYKKKSSGNWHYTKIAKATGLSSKTVAKIIKDYTNNQ